MNWKRVLVLTALLWLGVFSLYGQTQTDYYTPENVRRFAEYLQGQKEFERAAGEYLRYLYLFQQLPADADQVFFQIGCCYREVQKYDKAIDYFQRILTEFPASNLLDACSFQIAHNYFLWGKYGQSAQAGLSLVAGMNGLAEKNRLRQLVGVNYLYEKRWKSAQDYFLTLKRDGLAGPETEMFAQLAKQGLRLPRKDPALAAFLSALLPGSGKFYAKRKLDAVFSLITVAAAAWQAYDGFHRQGIGSVKGWIYGVIGAFFYVGNIYGSVVAVNIYNTQVDEAFQKKMGVVVSVYFR